MGGRSGARRTCPTACVSGRCCRRIASPPLAPPADPRSPLAAVAPEGPVGEVYRSAAASIAHDWDDYLFMGHTGHSAVPAAAAFAADHERVLLAQVAANEAAGRLGAALFLGPHNGQFWASIHCCRPRSRYPSGSASTPAHGPCPGDRPLSAPVRDVAGIHGPESKLLTAAEPAAAEPGRRCWPPMA